MLLTTDWRIGPVTKRELVSDAIESEEDRDRAIH